MLTEKIEQLKKDSQQLEQQLSGLSSEPEKIKQLSITYTEIKTLLGLYEKLAQINVAISEAESTISESDAELQILAEEELVQLVPKKAELEELIDEIEHPASPYDKKNIIMEIRAGTGGDEAALFAADLFRMYSRFAERRGWKTNLISVNRTGIGGFKEIIFEISGENVYSNLKFESGVHRVQRVPETEKSGRVHTSAATVAVMPEVEELDLKIDAKDLEIEATTSTGNGGQSVNTTYSAIRITHKPTGIVVKCQDERSQQQNKAKAMQVLRARLLAYEEEKRMTQEAAMRKSQVGSGDRSEKIRTYNYPQNRFTDHRIGLTLHSLDLILDGDIEHIIRDLKKAEKKQLT